MSNLNEVLRKIYKDLFCPVCGQNYKVGQLKIKGLVANTLTVQTLCDKGHATLFMTTLNHVKQIKTPAVSADDCIHFHQILSSFNGDFDRLWKKLP